MGASVRIHSVPIHYCSQPDHWSSAAAMEEEKMWLLESAKGTYLKDEAQVTGFHHLSANGSDTKEQRHGVNC